MTDIRDSVTIEIKVDSTLLEHFRQHIEQQNLSITPDAAITTIVTRILNGSAYPVSAKRTNDREITISYHIRSFSQPIF